MKLPMWATELRDQQQHAIDLALKLFENGTNVVMLDAPTGTGKTLIAEMIRQELEARALYLCTTLALQDQFARDFPDAAILRGRSNYATADDPSKYPFLSAADCTKRRVTSIRCQSPCEACPPHDCACIKPTCLREELKINHCRWCHPVYDCPYEAARYAAWHSDLVCTNVSYFLHEANFGRGILAEDRELIIVDEADMLEEQLLNFVSLSISEKQQAEYRIHTPEKKTVQSAWIEWAQITHARLETLAIEYRCGPHESDVKLLRRERAVNQLLADVALLLHPEDGLANENWIYTSYDRNVIEFKPIHVNTLAHSRFWRHGSMFLLMSATMISFDAVAETLGLK